MNTQPLVLCILDGFGLNPNPDGNAVAQAKTPCIDKIMAECPHTTLCTHGEMVGLPEGQMGNSEVGHLNIGAGRVVEQWLLRISRALERGIADNEAMQSFVASLGNAKRIHLTGLVSPGGIHAHTEHLKALLPQIRSVCDLPIAIHIITDGRDTGPESGVTYVQDLEAFCRTLDQVQIASIIGRFYAMDRDKRWERTEKACRLFCNGEGSEAASASAWLTSSYNEGVTDEFIEPAVIDPSRCYEEGDAFIFFNFRADRMRQLVSALTDTSFTGFERSYVPVVETKALCFTPYDERFSLPALFQPLDIANYLGEVLSKAGLRQLRVAETEKYPHVTYFLNGGKEQESPGEERAMVPSPRDVKTYDLKPEMSAKEVSALVVKALTEGSHDVIVVNFANCDMVGHTGVLKAAITAVETVDSCLQDILNAASAHHARVLVFADHGNAEQLVNYETGTPHTAHTTFPVHCILVGADVASLRDGGSLQDIAPPALQLLGIEQPPEMTGRSLLK